MIMKKYISTVCGMGRFLTLTFILINLASVSCKAQISFNDDKGDNRKIRREAAKYKAEDVKESHLDLEKFSYKKGQAGSRPLTEEMEESVIYYGPNPVKAEKKSNKKKY